jgi:hypothetical protein
MKLKHIALTLALSILSVVSFSAMSAELDPIKQISAISSFGVSLGQPIEELPVTKKTSEYLYIQPKEPLAVFFDTYRVVPTPDNRVYKFLATGDLPDKNFTCIEAAAALNRSFLLKYDTSIIHPLESKNGLYVYMNDFVIASIQCIAGQISYSYAYRKDLDQFHVPTDKFKDVKINL